MKESSFEMCKRDFLSPQGSNEQTRKHEKHKTQKHKWSTNFLMAWSQCLSWLLHVWGSQWGFLVSDFCPNLPILNWPLPFFLFWGWRHETGWSYPVKYFTDRSKADLLLWILNVFFLSCVCYAFGRVCLFVPCGHLPWKGWPLGSRLWYITMSLSLSHWYPGSDVMLGCIDSWSLYPYLLWRPSLQISIITIFTCANWCP